MAKKIFTGIVAISALLYIFVLYTMLFALPNRAMVIISEHMLDNYNYWTSINFIPFKTVSEYITDIIDGSARGHAIKNLVGNLFLLFPLGFYFPFFLRKTADIKIYAVVVTVFIFIIETAQLITMTGSFDIDDFILNLFGALIGVIICKYTPINSLFTMRAY